MSWVLVLFLVSLADFAMAGYLYFGLLKHYEAKSGREKGIAAVIATTLFAISVISIYQALHGGGA